MNFESRKRIPLQLDLAPLIDVVFLLLIFFMLTSSMNTPEAVELNIPESSSGKASESSKINVSVSESGILNLNGQAVTLENLAAQIKPLLKSDDDTIALQTAADVSIQEIIKVMDEIKKAGGKSIAVQTQPGQNQVGNLKSGGSES